MLYKNGDIIKFKNGEYLVIDVIRNDGNTYLYLINNDKNLNDVAITKVKYIEGNTEYSYIENNEEFNFVLNKLFLNAKDDMILFALNE